MSSGVLKKLHDLHLKLQDVDDMLARGPKQIRAREQLADRKRQEKEDAETKLKDLKVTASNKNSDLQVQETKIGDLRAKLNTVTSNKEFDVIRTQIDADTAAKEVLEMEILETLDRIDQQQTAVGKAEEELKTSEAEVEQMRQKVAAAEPGLHEQAETLRTSLDEMERNLPGTVHESYRRLTVARGADALAPVENKTCAACYTKLSPQQAVEVNTDKFVFCKACGRLMYRAQTDDG